VDRARGVIRLEITKSGRRRDVPLSSNADAVLARRWTDGATGYVFGSPKWNRLRTAWETAVTASRIDDLRFHDLRHTFASWLVQRGRTLKEVQEALGHQTITMTMRYSHLAPDHLRAAVAALDGVLVRQPDSASLNVTTTAQEAQQQVKSRPVQLRTQVTDSKIAPVAQLDRASAFEAEGRGFDSLRARLLTRQRRLLSDFCGGLRGGEHSVEDGDRRAQVVGGKVLYRIVMLRPVLDCGESLTVPRRTTSGDPHA